MLIKNITAGDKGIYTKTGLVMIAPGQTVDVDLDDGEEASPEWFTAPNDGDDLDDAPAPVEMPIKKRATRTAKADG